MHRRTYFETKGVTVDSYVEAIEVDDLKKTAVVNKHKLEDSYIENEKSTITPEQKEYKTYFVDRHTVYVNNNNLKEEEVLTIIRNALTDAPHRSGQELPENHKLFSYCFVNAKGQGKKGEQNYKKEEDKTLVYFYDSRDYDFLLHINQETGFPLVTLNGVITGKDLTPALQTAINKELNSVSIDSWADEAEDTENIYWKYYLLALPLKHPKITVIPREYRKSWDSHLMAKGDIAILRCTATKCRPEYIENVLMISNIPPNWSENETKNYFTKFNTSNNSNYPAFEFRKDKAGKVLLSMTFDPKHKEAMFIQQLLRSTKVIGPPGWYLLKCMYFHKSTKHPYNKTQDYSSKQQQYNKTQTYNNNKTNYKKEVDQEGFISKKKY